MCGTFLSAVGKVGGGNEFAVFGDVEFPNSECFLFGVVGSWVALLFVTVAGRVKPRDSSRSGGVLVRSIRAFTDGKSAGSFLVG